MKNHIIFKFLAVFLCAVSLLGAVGSGFGIFAMTEMGLYQRTVEEAFAEHLENYAYGLGNEIAVRYAAMNEGGCTAELADQYYGTGWYYGYFNWNRLGYVLLDEEGHVLQEQTLEGPAEYTFDIPVFGQYLKILNTMTQEEYDALHAPAETEPWDGENTVYNIVPPEGAEVTCIEIEYADGSNGIYDVGGETLGILVYSSGNSMEFHSQTDFGGLTKNPAWNPAVRIRFLNEREGLLYEAQGPAGVVKEYSYTAGETFLRLWEYTEESQSSVVLYDAIPPEGIQVSRVHVTYADGFEESAGGEPDIGFLCYGEEGYVEFNTDVGVLSYYVDAPVTYIAFFDSEGSLVYEASDPEGVGSFTQSENQLVFRAGEAVPAPDAAAEEAPVETTVSVETSPAEETVPVTTEATETTAPVETTAEATAEATETTLSAETTEEPTVPESEVTTAPTDVTEPVAAASYHYDGASGKEYYGYYDSETETRMMAEYTYEDLPPYTMAIQLAEGALYADYEWDLLEVLYDWQDYLFPVLGGSLLLFAILAVYLCCAAGRKPGTDEIRAAGLNCIPLDLYLGIGILAEVALCWVGVEGVPHLLRHDIWAGLVFALLAAFVACLVFVAFCFACAAQFKTPGGYWWKNSLCARSVELLGTLLSWLLKGTVWLSKKCDTILIPLLVTFFKGLWKFLVVCWHLTGRAIAWLLQVLQAGGDRLWKALSRFFSLLPLTWQWLLTAFGMMLMMYLVYATNNEEFVTVICICLYLGIVLYGTHAFGTLLAAVKRMSKGDLDEKVDDKLLIGSFKDFAGELNGLADVAVVAAQKQLKSERMKTELITNVSHDIKTPLTSIINYVDLLQKPHTDKEQEIYLEVLDRQSQRLKKLIDDLMEMSKASTGNLAVEIEKVDAAEAVNQALGEFADKLEKAQLIPVFRQPESPIAMMADGRLVWRVMSNLLGNAVKYALPGTRVYLDLTQVEGKVILSMKNISREELNVNADELMERFVRGDTSRNTEGSGLGLNIAQSLMQLQKGQLQILVDGDLFKVTLIFPAAE